MIKPKYLHWHQIEAEAQHLLREYCHRFGETIVPVVPLEEIVDSYLDLDFRFENLSSLSDKAKVLGSISIEGRAIRIDESLDPEEFPQTEGRYRFTLAHEIGHWILHRSLVPNPDQLSLLEPSSQLPVEATVICRAQSTKNPLEWQADQFAGYLLMPEILVRQQWKEIHGTSNPYNAVNEIIDLSARWNLAETCTPTVEISRRMASIFRVSGQAMQIRLVGLNLIQTQPTENMLFDLKHA